MSVIHPKNIRDSQNFLKDSRLVAALLARCEIDPGDTVYEIGPGKGIITTQLADRCKQVVAIEKDPFLSAQLAQRLSTYTNVKICTADFLDQSLPRLPYKVFSNIPFNITSAIVTKLTMAPNPPEAAWLVVQKEAAERYQGYPSETLRSVLLKPWFALDCIHYFQRQDFIPAPSVDALLLRIRKRGPPLVSQIDRQIFRDFIVYGFTTWRENLGAIFKDIFSRRQHKQIKRKLGIDLGTTPTALSFEKWMQLFEVYKENASEYAHFIVSGSEQSLLRQQKRVQKVHRTRVR